MIPYYREKCVINKNRISFSSTSTHTQRTYLVFLTAKPFDLKGYRSFLRETFVRESFVRQFFVRQTSITAKKIGIFEFSRSF